MVRLKKLCRALGPPFVAGMTWACTPEPQLYAAQGNQIIADAGWGETVDGVPVTADSVMLWLSSTKPIGAAAILQLRERGLVDLDDPVARHIPEFVQQGKCCVTIRHLLTHTGGFRYVDIGWPEATWEEIIARIGWARLERDWVPGERAGYHPFTSWYILGEIIRRVDSRPYQQYVREAIFEPLAMNDSWIGMPPEVFRAYGNRRGTLWHMDKSPPELHRYSSERGATECVPGGNGHGPMRELARFYHMLSRGGTFEGARILSSESVQLMTSRQRTEMFDETFRHKMDWGLGLIIDSKHYGVAGVPYGYGRYASPNTFGHGGAQSSVGFCDPDHGLVVAIVFNGLPGEAKHNARIRAVLTALYEDLRLAGDV